jgi:hypothetical protein
MGTVTFGRPARAFDRGRMKVTVPSPARLRASEYAGIP